jgi:hypothetical protein
MRNFEKQGLPAKIRVNPPVISANSMYKPYRAKNEKNVDREKAEAIAENLEWKFKKKNKELILK